MPTDSTVFVIGERAEERDRRGFSTKIATAFLGKKPQRNPPHGEMFQFWHSIAFYNFVQECVGDNPYARPSKEALDASREGFSTVLANLAPRLVVVFSRLVWDVLKPHSPEEIPEFTQAGALVVGVPHPGARTFGNALHWYSAISERIERARQH